MGRVDVNGVGIEYEVTGQGRPVVLLHGFPDSGRLWRHQVPALAAAGFQVIVPDLRGYGRSDKPEGVEAYSLMALAGDVMAVLGDLGVARAHVVGHDWGAALAWGLASLAPGSVDHLAVLSVGHPATFRRTAPAAREVVVHAAVPVPRCRRAVAERRRLGQLPQLGRASRCRPGDRRPGGDRVAHAGPELVPGQRPARVLGAAAAALPPVQAPTMGVWSTGDIALTEAQMTDSAENVAGPWRYERLDGPGHWMQLEAPDQVNELLLDFLR